MNSTSPATPRARRLLLPVVLIILASLNLHAGGRRRAVAAPRPADELAITFVDAPGGLLDAGSITGSEPRRDSRSKARSTITKKTFGLRIGRPSRETQGTATLSAFLETADPRCIVRLDGIVLGTQPRLLDRFAPIGTVTTHRLEIEVPASAPEGALVTNIGWLVSTD
jgi:hypothetical protein